MFFGIGREMKINMENAGLKIIPKAENNDKAIKLYSINNPDGSIRWLWKARSKTPVFLKFYAVTGLKSKLFAIVVRLLFIFRLQHLFLGRRALWASIIPGHSMEKMLSGNFALFTGTPGPNRKLVLYASEKGVKPQFVKISLSSNSERLLAKEFENANFIRCNNLASLEVPDMIMVNNRILSTTDISPKAKRSTTFGQIHANALAELLAKSNWANTPDKLDCMDEANHHLAMVADMADNRIPAIMVRKLSKLRSLIGDHSILTSFAHCDFTPWNTYVKKKQLGVYDWELAKHAMPAAYDMFHFIIQKGILTERKPWQAIRGEAAAAFDILAKKTKLLNSADFERYLALYLYLNTTYYLEVYSRQAEWHKQVAWLVSTWDEAINDLLNGVEKTRPMFIGSLFGYLYHWDYAAIKFPEHDPALLSEYADIDLCMRRNDAKILIKYLKNHSMVKKVVIKRKTYMVQLMLVLKNDSLLALDLIFGFKRRHIRFMELQPVLTNAHLNSFGVKVMGENDTAHYLSCFYGLNGSQVPEKYHQYFPQGKVENENRLDLIKSLSDMAFNRGFYGLKNRLVYFFDSLNSLFFNHGLIVTFSGVDGAGKSTVIELAKREIEKKLRKSVVVIRHRPSLLPILSSVKYGREKAGQMAAQNLPRQGTNNSTLGSLLRFAYYYTDYFFGQFYVHARYVMRGKVVLYDRYYFDFINDSKRSNIQLPKWLLKTGYFFLMKPRFNFFLYADANTILARKQELDAGTINKLTTDYLDLFNSLNGKGKKRYLPIENIVLDDTLAYITCNVSQQLTR